MCGGGDRLAHFGVFLVPVGAGLVFAADGDEGVFVEGPGDERDAEGEIGGKAAGHGEGREAGEVHGRDVIAEADRKSTRLNSSH